MPDMLYAAVGLSLAMAIGYLVKYSSVVRSLLGLPDNTECTTPSTTQTSLSDSAGPKTPTANAATQTSIEHDPPPLPPHSPSFNLPTDPVKPASSAVADRRLLEAEGASGSSRAASLEKKAATATEAEKMLQKQMDKIVQETEGYRQLIAKMEAENGQLRERLAEQAKIQLTKGPSKFENLNLGENRPSMLVKRYGDLYTDDRIEAWDALDLLPQDIDDDSKQKLLFSIVVLCFRQAQSSFEGRLRTVRTILLSSSSGATSGTFDGQDDETQLNAVAREIEDCVESCLRRTVSRYDISDDFKEVTSELWSKLADYPSLRDCQSLLRYMEQCLKTAWALTIQNPGYVIDYHDDVFSDDRHTRFYTSDPDSVRIQSFLWPALIEKSSGYCASKAVVVT